jgi:hypothetical protein
MTTSTQQGSSMAAPLSEASQIPLDRMMIRKMFPNTSKFNNTPVLTKTWATSPFRVYFNAGDLLDRQREPGGSNQVKGSVGIGQYRNTLGSMDGTMKGNGASGNQHFVYDSSDYIKFKRLRAKMQNYNDTSFGGSNNGAYSFLMAVRH